MVILRIFEDIFSRFLENLGKLLIKIIEILEKYRDIEILNNISREF